MTLLALHATNNNGGLNAAEQPQKGAGTQFCEDIINQRIYSRVPNKRTLSLFFFSEFFPPYTPYSGLYVH